MTDAPFRTAAGDPVPVVTADEMRKVDRVAVEDVGLELLQMMENAGRTLAWHVGDVVDGPVVVVAGNGGNGGGGLACARHLANHEVPVRVVVDRDAGELTGATARQYRILEEMETPVSSGTDALDSVEESAAIVDALVGYGLEGELREPASSLVEAMNRRSAITVSLDVPSGTDATTGAVAGAAVDPDRVVTLALPKTGLVEVAGSLYLADIGVPRTVYDRLDVEYANPFGSSAWVELHRNESVSD